MDSAVIRDRLRTLRDQPSDAGTSLMELVVGMALLAVFLTIFTTSFLVVTNTVNKVGAVTNTAAQVNYAFQSLDRKVRYAAAITKTGKGTGGDWYVEYDTTNTGTEVCTQLRVDSGALQSRTWTVAGTGYTNLTTWTPLASGLTNGGSTATTSPFGVGVSTASSSFQQLTVTVTVASDTSTAATTTSAMTFTAVNSSASRDTSSFCTQVARP